MWSNVEVCSQMEAGHTHLEEWGGEGDGTCTVGSWGEKQARTQVNRPRAQFSIHVLTCRLGLGCKVIQGATQLSVDSWEWDAFIRSPAVAPRAGGGLNIHVQLPGQGGLL